MWTYEGDVGEDPTDSIQEARAGDALEDDVFGRVILVGQSAQSAYLDVRNEDGNVVMRTKGHLRTAPAGAAGGSAVALAIDAAADEQHDEQPQVETASAVEASDGDAGAAQVEHEVIEVHDDEDEGSESAAGSRGSAMDREGAADGAEDENRDAAEVYDAVVTAVANEASTHKFDTESLDTIFYRMLVRAHTPPPRMESCMHDASRCALASQSVSPSCTGAHANGCCTLRHRETGQVRAHPHACWRALLPPHEHLQGAARLQRGNEWPRCREEQR